MILKIVQAEVLDSSFLVGIHKHYSPTSNPPGTASSKFKTTELTSSTGNSSTRYSGVVGSIPIPAFSVSLHPPSKIQLSPQNTFQEIISLKNKLSHSQLNYK